MIPLPVVLGLQCVDRVRQPSVLTSAFRSEGRTRSSSSYIDGAHWFCTELSQRPETCQDQSAGVLRERLCIGWQRKLEWDRCELFEELDDQRQIRPSIVKGYSSNGFIARIRSARYIKLLRKRGEPIAVHES